MLKPLIWKEWHEQRWKMAFGTVMLVFFTCSFYAARLSTQREFIIVVWILGGLVLSLYSAIGAFAPETTNGTKIFLSSKPLQPWKVFCCKWFIGWLNFVVPMLVCILVLSVIILSNHGWRFFELGYIARGTFAGICMGTVFYSMTSCFAPRKSNEAIVGLTGCIVFVIYMLHQLVSYSFTITIPDTSYDTGLTLFQELFWYINPLFWMYYPLHFEIHHGFQIIEQGILFVITIWVGLRKWRRAV